MDKKDKSTFGRDFRRSSRLFVLLVFVVLFFPYLFTQFSWVNFNLEETGQIGDTIGGTMGPFIAIIASGLTFIAFWVQYTANESQREDIQLERFENKFYQMIDLHMRNIEEMEISGRHRGRKSFVKMYYEYRYIYQLLKKMVENRRAYISEECICKIAYNHFFFGVDDYTKAKYLKEKNSVEELLIEHLKKDQSKFEKYKNKCLWRGRDIANRPFFTNSGVKFELETDFYPFDGHVSKLGHYYRHLYHSIKYVVRNDNKVQLNWKEKYSYVKMIRSQLSNHEQALIYFNSFWIKDKVWWSDLIGKDNKQKVSYFLDYAIIKNVPFDLTDSYGPVPKEEFRKELEKLDSIKIDLDDDTTVCVDDKMEWLFEWDTQDHDDSANSPA